MVQTCQNIDEKCAFTYMSFPTCILQTASIKSWIAAIIKFYIFLRKLYVNIYFMIALEYQFAILNASFTIHTAFFSYISVYFNKSVQMGFGILLQSTEMLITYDILRTLILAANPMSVPSYTKLNKY
jgi:hypothetical protein